jgi:hypothetical protein
VTPQPVDAEKDRALLRGLSLLWQDLTQPIEKRSPATEKSRTHDSTTLADSLTLPLVANLDAGSSRNWGNREPNDQPLTTTTPRPAVTDDGDHERLGTSISGLQDQHDPRATQLRPIPGLPAVEARKAVSTRVPIEATPTSRGLGRTFLGGTPFLVAGACLVAGAWFVVAGSWPPGMDFAEAPIPVPTETRPATPSPLPQTVPQPIQPNGRTAEGGSSEQELTMSSEDKLTESGIPLPTETRPATLTPLPQAVLQPIQPKSRTAEGGSSERGLTMSSEDKLTESGIEVRPPQVLPATEYRTKGETSGVAGSNSVHQASPSSSADAALDALASEPPRKRPFAPSAHVSTCFPSASAVRQDNPTAWPSWTLRAPGHEGTKCWYAGTRATVYDH